ncbi:Mpv17 / PMP22 family [Plasmodiophora brassicae]
MEASGDTAIPVSPPLVADVVASGLLWAIGDVVAQKLDVQSDGIDSRRLARQAVFGAFILAPLARSWYLLLSVMLPEASLPSTIAKVALDQTIWAVTILSLMYVSLSVMQGAGVQHGLSVVRARIRDTMKANWCVWPLVQAVNLTFVPVRHQLLIVNLVSIPWSAYLSIKANRSGGGPEGISFPHGEHSPLASQRSPPKKGGFVEVVPMHDARPKKSDWEDAL